MKTKRKDSLSSNGPSLSALLHLSFLLCPHAPERDPEQKLIDSSFLGPDPRNLFLPSRET